MIYIPRKCIVLICLIIFLGSFSLKAQEIVRVSKDNFPSKLKIKGVEILTNDFNHHHKIFVFDTLILTMVNSGPYHYHVFHKDKLKYLGAIGVRGEGPEQWQIPATTAGQFEKAADGIKVWHFDYLRGSFMLINITKTIKSKSVNPKVDRQLRINAKVFPFFQLFIGNNQKLYANSWIYEQNSSRIKSYDIKTTQISKSPLFPLIKDVNRLPSETINSLYGGAFDKHPKKDLFIQATFVFDRIDFFDENLKVIKSIVDGENWKDNYYNGKEIIPSQNYLRPRINGYDGLSIGEKFIFALEAKLNVGTDKFKEYQSFIRVFSIDGKPLSYIEVPHDLSSIDFDEVKNVLYATDYEHEQVLKFDLTQHVKTWVK
jgi:hypothetical protein